MIIPANFSQKELCEIYHNLSTWEWDERLGNKPLGFDMLPNYNYRFIHKLIKRKTKSDIIGPIIKHIKTLVPHKEILRHHHIYNLRKTNDQFESWWQNVHSFL